MLTKMSLQKAEKSFISKLREIGGQNPYLCMQCGNCSAVCPMVEHMEISPRMVLRLSQLGMEDRLRKFKSFWVCSSCYSCGVQCPRGIKIPSLLEALRLMTLRQNVNYIEPSSEVVSGDDYPQIALVAALRKMSS